MGTNKLEAGVTSIDLITEKHGNSFRVLALVDGNVGKLQGSGESLESIPGFAESAPEGVHMWRMTLIIERDMRADVDGVVQVPMGGSSLMLRGVAPQDVIDKVEAYRG